MSTEVLNPIDSQELITNTQEKQKEAISKETDRLYDSLDNFSLEQIHSLVDNLSVNNPKFQEEFKNFQDTNSTKAIEMLKFTSESIEAKNSNFDYFWIDPTKMSEIKSELKILNLDINEFLEWYKNYIETNLSWLTEEQKSKVKLSISNKVLAIWKVIQELKWELKNWEDFKNNRWIINEKIGDNFSEMNNKISPSLSLLSKINSWEKINLKEDWLYDVSEKFEEIKKMLWSEVLPNWDFDKTWKSWELIDANTNNWNILYTENKNDARFLDEKWIKWIEWVSLLNDTDKQIEKTAQYTFYALLAVQIWIEFTPIWWTVWAWIDWADVISSEDSLMKITKIMPWVDSNYKIEKTWIDNTLATIWLIPWLTILTKSPKLANWIFKLNPSELKDFMNILDKSLDKIAKKMWWNAEYITKIRYFLEWLFLKQKQWMPIDYLKSLEESWFIANKRKWDGNMNIPEEYKKWEQKWIPYKEFISEAVKKNEKWLTLNEAHVIYWYTNGVFYKKLNKALENAKTPEETEEIMNLQLVKDLVSWLSKFPIANNIQYRWHNLPLSETYNWKEILLKGFSSSSNKPTEPFFSNQKRDQLIIQNSKAIDISELSFFVHHADRLWNKYELVEQESVFLPWTIVKAINKKIIEDKTWTDVTRVKAVQIK